MDSKKYTLINLAITLLIITTCFASRYAYAENMDPDDDGAQYAWEENVGWINFQPTWGPGVTVTNTAVTGNAMG
jgi:hypothetical protein